MNIEASNKQLLLEAKSLTNLYNIKRILNNNMNKRQNKKHLKKADKYAIFSFELAERYLKRYHLWDCKYDEDK